MNKKLKIFLLAIFAFICLTFFNSADANSIDSISMDIAIDNNGNVSVTGILEMLCKPRFRNLSSILQFRKSVISNLSVYDGKKTYSTLSSWNTSGSLDSKAYKCGINEVSNGIELCWGISKYGSHNYIVKYNISNFVSELTDSQMIYWTLIPHNFSNSIGNAYIKIHTIS